MGVERYSRPESAPGATVPTAPSARVSLPSGSETELVARFHERLRVFAARRLGDAAAEDVAQEALRRVIEALRSGRLRDPAALPSFVFETARHVCQHRLRSEAREGRALERFHLTSTAETASSIDPLLNLERVEIVEQVRTAMERLPKGDVEILRLFFFEGLDTAAVGRRLDLEVGATRVRKHRALRRLDALLAEAER